MEHQPVKPLFRVVDEFHGRNVGGLVLEYMGTYPRHGAAIMVAADLLHCCCNHGETGMTPDCGTFRPDLASAQTKSLLNNLPGPILDITKKMEGMKITREVFVRWLDITKMYLEHPSDMARA